MWLCVTGGKSEWMDGYESGFGGACTCVRGGLSECGLRQCESVNVAMYAKVCMIL